MSGAEVGACSGCQPCQDCGHHVPKARIPALCEECAVRRPDTPGWIHAGEWRITLADARAARDEVADELARHADTMAYNTRDHETVRLGCRCGFDRGTVTKAELAADLDGRMREHRLHVADAVIAVLNGPQSPPSHAGRAEGGGRMYSGGPSVGLTSQDEMRKP